MDLKRAGLKIYASFGVPRRVKKREAVLVVVGMVESSHFQSWIRATISQKIFDYIWIIPSDYPVSRFTKKSLGLPKNIDCKLKVFNFPLGIKINHALFRLLDLTLGRRWRSVVIYRYIRRAKPNFLHFHELQHGAYLFNPVAKYFEEERNFKIICSSWGSDLIFYGELDSHKNEIKKVFSWVDLVTAERVDEEKICKRLGYEKDFLAPVYNTVGVNVPIKLPSLKPSARRKILIKGYQDRHGRALNALAALELVKTNLDNFEIRIFSASDAVRLQVEFLSSAKQWDIQVINRTSNLEIKKHFSESRLYIGLAISDGLSTSMVEAMANGAFPIQSLNSAVKIFTDEGISGFAVDPWDLFEIAKDIDVALNDDALVDKASIINIETLQKKYNYADGVALLKKIYSN
jgi:hypothetical protein